MRKILSNSIQLCKLLPLIATMLLTVGTAMADTIDDFTLTNPTLGVLTFSLPASPITNPSGTFSGNSFEVIPVPGELNSSAISLDLIFWNIAGDQVPLSYTYADALTINYGPNGDNLLVDLSGVNANSAGQLYTGDETAPTFLPGTYPEWNYFSPTNGIYTLTITPEVSSVPVPGAVWLFGSAIAGFGLFGRRKSTLAA